MGLFGGGGGKTVTTVKADPHVESILKNILGEVKNTPIDTYIAHQNANLTSEQKQTLGNIANSGDLKTAAALTQPQFAKGMQQVADNNKYLQSQLDAPVTVNQVLSDRNLAVTNNLNKAALSKAVTSPSRTVQGSAGARSAMRRNAGLLTASNAFNRGAEGASQGISLRQSNQANRVSDLGQMSNIARGNVQLGLQGNDLQRQATQNQLNVGNILQQQQQQEYENAYNNANAATLFPNQQLQNKLNLVTQASNMAGYKQYGTQATNTSAATKIAGLGLGVAGLMGSTGAFTTNPANAGKNLSFGQNWMANANTLAGNGSYYGGGK